MRRATAAILSLALVASLAIASTALAQFIPGGHDETSEGNAALWATGPPSPGVGPAGVSGHLILTEIAVTPTAAEFVEIHNPTSVAIALDKYYLSDAWFEPGPVGYHQLPTGTLVVGTNTDFVVRFPAGSTIGPGATQTMAMDGAGFTTAYGAAPTYQVVASASPAPVMINLSGGTLLLGTTSLTNGSELVVLFFWDGLSDNVCDVDYVTWGPATTTSRADKTGISQDGPDGDALGTAYLPDTPDAGQSTVTAPGAGASVARLTGTEGAESTPGNGCTSGGPTPTRTSTWGELKIRHR